MTTFYTILTDRGKSKLSACIAAGTRLPLSSIKVGEGLNGAYYDPVASQTALQSPVWTGDILSMMVSPDNPEWLMVEAIIPVDKGGWYIREGGVYDEDGELFAIGQLPESYKPQISSGAGKTMSIVLVLQVGQSAPISLNINNDSAYCTLTRHIADLLALGTEKTNELNAAIAALDATYVKHSAFGANLAPNGHQILPSGLIHQWGTAITNSSGYADVYYPIAFTEQVLSKHATPVSSTYDNVQYSITVANDVYVNSLTMCRFLGRKESSKRAQIQFNFDVYGT